MNPETSKKIKRIVAREGLSLLAVFLIAAFFQVISPDFNLYFSSNFFSALIIVGIPRFFYWLINKFDPERFKVTDKVLISILSLQWTIFYINFLGMNAGHKSFLEYPVNTEPSLSWNYLLLLLSSLMSVLIFCIPFILIFRFVAWAIKTLRSK